MEWIDKYNSFNSYKGLTYYKNYKKVGKWMEGRGELPAPVECNLDPYASCNLSCYFCVVQRYIRNHREEVVKNELPEEYLHRLIEFLSRWGVRGLCISGGGEPSLHPRIEWIVGHASGVMETALVSNMTKVVKSSAYCKWVAMSVDAGGRETYKRVKGVDRFDEVIGNIKQLVRARDGVQKGAKLCYKFLVLPENQGEIYEACKLARELGVQHFHARPVDFERVDIEGHKKLEIDVERVREQFEKCHELGSEDFKVFTVTHKFDNEFHVKHDFDKCLASPLVVPILTDGKAYLCVDHKMEERFKLGSCYPDPEAILEWWGSDAHRDLIKSVDINKCSRCTWSQYNQQMENMDRMDLSFP